MDEEPAPAPPPVTVYANWILPRPNEFDLALDFGQKLLREDEPEFAVRVLLSWEEALVLRNMLNNQIAAFEEHVGAIRKADPRAFPDDDLTQNGGPHGDDHEGDEE